MGGGVLGVIAHESIHWLLAQVLGSVEQVGWAGSISGGPFVEYYVPESIGNWRSEAIRKGPLLAGILGAVGLFAGFDGVTLPWIVAAGAVAGLLWTSPEDLFHDAATQEGKAA